MAKPKTTKTVPADSLENVPAEDQAKVTKKRGRPAKTKPVTEELPQEEVSDDQGTADAVDLAGTEQNAQEVAGVEESDEDDGEAEATSSNKENSKPGPGTRSKQKKAGLTFPILKIKQNLKKGKSTQPCACAVYWIFLTFYSPGNYQLTNRNRWEAPIYLAAVLEYLTAEVLELAGDIAKHGKKGRVTPRHIMLAIRNDEEVRNFSISTFHLICSILTVRSTSSCLGSPSLLEEFFLASTPSSCLRSLSEP